MNNCKYCNNKANRIYKIKPCANGRYDIAAGLIYDIEPETGDRTNPGIVIFANTIAAGYFNINYCPICGRKLREDLINGDE